MWKESYTIAMSNPYCKNSGYFLHNKLRPDPVAILHIPLWLAVVRSVKFFPDYIITIIIKGNSIFKGFHL